jgi:hypothetical protein
MEQTDKFSRTLVEEAKRFLEKAKEEVDSEGQTAYLHAALLLGFGALEAHVNSIAEDFLVRSDLSILDRSLLAEREFRLQNGTFDLIDQLKMYRLEDRIEFLYRRFAGTTIDKTSEWWGGMKTGLILRNKLVHPKESPSINYTSVENALKAILSLIDALYNGIFKTAYPAARRGLQSSMRF